MAGNPYTAQLKSFTASTSNARRGLIDLYKLRRKGVEADYNYQAKNYGAAWNTTNRQYGASLDALGDYESGAQGLINQSGYGGRQGGGTDARRDPALKGIVKGGVDPFRQYMGSEREALHAWYKGLKGAAQGEDKTLKAGLAREQPAALSELEQGIIDTSTNLQAQAGAYSQQQQMLQQQQSYMQQMLNYQGQQAAAATGGSVPTGATGTSAAENWIIGKESSGNVHADNPTSTAFGLGQLLISNRRTYAAKIGVSPDTTDYGAQLQMMRMYIKDRYGTAQAAMAFWQAHGWY